MSEEEEWLPATNSAWDWTALGTGGWKKKAPEAAGANEAREMRSSESDKSEGTYLLSAMGLAPRSRRPLTAVRAARAAGMLAAAAP